MGRKDTEIIKEGTFDLDHESMSFLAEAQGQEELISSESNQILEMRKDALQTSNIDQKQKTKDLQENTYSEDTTHSKEETMLEIEKTKSNCDFHLQLKSEQKTLISIFKVTKDQTDVPTSLSDSSPSILLNLKKCSLKILKQPRKMLPDSLRKKIKTHFHHYLINYFNKLIVDYYKFKKYVIQKINKEKTLKVSIDYCSRLLKLTMKELFSSEISTKCTRKKADHNQRIIQILEQKADFISFLNKSYEEMFVEYRKSKAFMSDVLKLKQKFGTYYYKLFIMIADDFINYYKKEKPFLAVPSNFCAVE